NPLVYAARRELDRACELSCDEAVIRRLDEDGKKHYGNTLLSLAAESRMPRAVVSTTMVEGKQALKERLGAIMKNKKDTRAAVVVSAALVVLAVGAAVALGAGGQADTQSDTRAYPQSDTRADTQTDTQSDPRADTRPAATAATFEGRPQAPVINKNDAPAIILGELPEETSAPPYDPDFVFQTKFSADPQPGDYAPTMSGVPGIILGYSGQSDVPAQMQYTCESGGFGLLKDGIVTALGSYAERDFGVSPRVHWTPGADTKDGDRIIMRMMSFAGDGGELAAVILIVRTDGIRFSLTQEDPAAAGETPELSDQRHKRMMTLADLRDIANSFGADLTLNDLGGFIGEDVGSGLFVMRYDVDGGDAGTLLLTVGAGAVDTPVMFTRLSGGIYSGGGADIRHVDDIDAFLAGEG
ncbi:MAG: hypothetical protein LBU58_09590, partial [Clostridiales bacterium]|nr:hypothetical protein [Clostridiales bacterium]